MIREWRFVIVFMAVAWGAALAWSTLAGRALYADGAWALLHLLTNPLRFNDYDFQRSFAVFIIQGPILFAQRFGLESLSGYAALLSLGPFVAPAIAMMAALVLSRRQPGLFAMNGIAILVFGFGANFVITEANLLFGLVWLAVTIMSLEGRAPLLRGFVLPVIAFLLLRVYEGMLLAGPVLGLWAILASSRVQDAREQMGVALSALLFLLAAAIAVSAFLSPRDPGNASNFRGTAFFFLRNPQVLLLLASLLTVPAMFTASRRAAAGFALASAACAVAFLVLLARLEGFYAHAVYYQNRSFLVFTLPLFLAAALAVYALRPAWLGRALPPRRVLVLLVPFTFAIAGDLLGTYRWSAYIDEFCAVLDKPLSPRERLEHLKAAGVTTAWPWTHPSLSVLLRPRGSNAMVVNEPNSGWQPFEPDKAPALNQRGMCQSPLLGEEREDTGTILVPFADGRYPSQVAAVEGLSSPEGWGTWSDGPRFALRFKRKLPRAFDLLVRVNTAIGDNRRLPVRVSVGDMEQSFQVSSEPFEATLQFRQVDADTIVFHIPKPQTPRSLGIGPDDRLLGIGMASVTIAPR